jgi:hypothetical protein
MKRVVILGIVAVILLVCIGLAMHVRVDPAQLLGWLHSR